jgi:hypothetical protein
MHTHKISSEEELQQREGVRRVSGENQSHKLNRMALHVRREKK